MCLDEAGKPAPAVYTAPSVPHFDFGTHASADATLDFGEQGGNPHLAIHRVNIGPELQRPNLGSTINCETKVILYTKINARRQT